MPTLTDDRKRSTTAQHCISVMRAEQLKMSIFAPKKLCGGRTVNALFLILLDPILHLNRKKHLRYKEKVFSHIFLNPYLSS